jgi:hypothetical protein
VKRGVKGNLETVLRFNRSRGSSVDIVIGLHSGLSGVRSPAVAGNVPSPKPSRLPVGFFQGRGRRCKEAKA